MILNLKLPIRKNSDGIYECVSILFRECTCAYIMDWIRCGDKWKEYELLHQMINETHRSETCSKRELLKVFGGTLDINEFNNKTYNLVYHGIIEITNGRYSSDKVNEEESSSFLKHSSNLKLGQLNLDNVDAYSRKNKF